MRIAHYWTAGNWLLLICGLCLELAVLIVSIRRGLLRSFLMLPLFAGFGFAADVTTLVIGLTVKVDAANGLLYVSRLYFTYYWYQQCAIGALLLLLVLQCLSLALPPWSRLLGLGGIVFFAGLAIAYLRIFPSWEPSKILEAVTISSGIAIIALALIAVVSSKEWPPGMRSIVAGLVLSAGLQGACTMLAEHYHTMQGFAAYGIPFAGLLGMIFYLLGAYRMRPEQQNS